VQSTRIAMVGAGLSGLYAAHLLERRGFHDYVLLEARDEPGGRIASVTGSGQPAAGMAASAEALDRFDLGPTWFWPDYQRELGRLIQDLGMQVFEQFETGDMMVEPSPDEAPARIRGYTSSPASIRMIGGMSALVNALRRTLDPARIIAGHRVRLARIEQRQVVLESETANGVATWQAEHVLLALPPRLAEASIAFDPALPHALAQQWKETATWMAPHAKYIAIYDTPFWRDQGLSGDARSARGPMAEIHDASMPGGSAALFGFIGVPARVRQTVSDDVLRTHCRAQLVRLFGAQAATPRADVIKDWAQDPYTATAADMDGAGTHAGAPDAAPDSGPWCGRLMGVASEWSPQFPGYVAGAIEAALLAVQALAIPPVDAGVHPSNPIPLRK
jgi:monoamine oxidase